MSWVRRLSLVSFALLLSSFLGLACTGGQASSTENSDETSESGATSSSSSADEGSAPQIQKRVDVTSQIPETVERVLPAVVGISTQRVVEARPHQFPFGNPFFDPFGGNQPRQERRKQGMGSGVIVDKNGTILTNNHVVEGADEIRVSFSDRRKEFSAEIVGSDQATDVAVLKLKNPPGDLKPISIGNSDGLKLGEPVLAIGNPFGLNSSVTYGIVSAKGRANVGLADYEDFIQTDAAINPGNSGGALVNLEGELIGINTAILSRSGGYQGIGFAIPSNMAQSVMRKLLETGEVRRGYLGVLIQTLTPELAEAFEVSSETRGVVVSRVKEGGPADEAGLKRGDLILRLDGESVEDANDLRNRIAQKSPGKTVEFQIRRDGSEKTLTVELGALHGGSGARAQLDQMGVLKGLVLQPVDQEAREEFRIPKSIDQGLVVAEIERGSPAARTGLRPGDVILEANRRPVGSITDFEKAYEKARGRLLLLLYRDRGTLFLPIPK